MTGTVRALATAGALIVLALAVTVVSASAGATAASSCKYAKIDGKRTCLKPGKRCSRKHQRAYQRAGFSCVKSKSRYILVRDQQAF